MWHEKEMVQQNAPPQHRPLNVLLAPSTYLPPKEHAHVSSVSTSRSCWAPTAPCGAHRPRRTTFSRGCVGLGEERYVDFSSFHASKPPAEALRDGALKEALTAEVGMLTRPITPLRSQAVDDCSSSVNAATVGPLPSIWAQAYGESAGQLMVSEACQFSPAEQEGLLALRKHLVRCADGLAELDKLLAEGEGLALGLPSQEEWHRARLRGSSSTFSTADAQRELSPGHLMERLKSYTAFCEAALANGLDSEPRPRLIMEPAPFNPAQLAGRGVEEVRVCRSVDSSLPRAFHPHAQRGP